MTQSSHRFIPITGALLALVSVALLGAYLLLDKETQTLSLAQLDDLPGQHYPLDVGATYVQRSGAEGAPLVVLIHGFSVPSFVWYPIVDALAAGGYQVVQYDLIGRGYSARPDTDYGLSLYVSQLDQLLHALSATQPIHLVGLSMGGAIATEFTLKFPEKIDSLSLIAPLVVMPDRLPLKLLDWPGLGPYLAKVVMVPMVENGLDRAVLEPDRFPEWARLITPQMQYVGYARALLRTMQSLQGFNHAKAHQQLAELALHPLLVWGEEDQTTPVTDSSLIVANNSKVIFRRIPKAGHLPHWEHPDRVSRWLLEHFKSEAE